MKRDTAIDWIVGEFNKATVSYGKFHSKHEGYAILKEEVDELWDAIKKNHSSTDMAKEAAQIGAMAICFLAYCCSEEPYHD